MNKEWMSISDMMSGLMLVFLFIAISFMVKVESQMQEMKDVALEYRDVKANLNEALYEEFGPDLQKWNATITEDNRVAFNAPDVLFSLSSSEISDEFKTVLEEFFVRYVKILTAKEFQGEIEELRVEGHTSKSWKNASSHEEIYLKNMQLSQERAYGVLSFCYTLKSEEIEKHRDWLEKHFRANGMAFSKSRSEGDSRRVEFGVTLKSEERVTKLLRL